MIVEIEGVVGDQEPGLVVIQTAQGLGYGVEVPLETAQKLPARGERVRLYTHLVIREEQWRLIGFTSVAERQVFRDLLEVQGVGVKAALSLMSHLGLEALRRAVLKGEWEQLKKAPGIGAKTAQRIQLELSGRWSKDAVVRSVESASDTPPTAAALPLDDVVLALMSLGYGADEAQAALTLVTADNPQDRLRRALQTLDRGRVR
jgi:Holliday junction DNA helicase RuvA